MDKKTASSEAWIQNILTKESVRISQVSDLGKNKIAILKTARKKDSLITFCGRAVFLSQKRRYHIYDSAVFTFFEETFFYSIYSTTGF